MSAKMWVKVYTNAKYERQTETGETWWKEKSIRVLMRRCEGKKPVAKLYTYKGKGISVATSEDTDCSKCFSVSGLREHGHWSSGQKEAKWVTTNSKWALVLEFTVMEMQRLVIFSTIISVNVLKEQRNKEGEEGRKNERRERSRRMMKIIGIYTVFARIICALFFYFGRWKIGVRTICGFFFVEVLIWVLL